MPNVHLPYFLRGKTLLSQRTAHLPERNIQSDMEILNTVNKTSKEIFCHTKVLNLKYLCFDKVSVSFWCFMLARKFFQLFPFIYLRIHLILCLGL